MQKVIGVIGCGRISDIAHFPTLSQIEGVRIKYGCDIIPEKAEAMKKKYPKIERTVADYKEVLADPEVDAVYVLTPNYAHYTITMDALKAGKHVFCEKPITVNYKLSQEMAEEARRQGKLLNIGVCNRFSNAVALLERYNREKKFGDIYNVFCSFRAFRSIPGLGGPFTTKAQSGGGVLIDWGVHYLDLILYVLGNPKIETASCDAYCEMAKDMKSYKYRGMWAENTKDLNGTNDVDDYIAGHIRTEKASITFVGAWAQNIDKDEDFIDFLGDKAGARLTYGESFVLYDGATLGSIVPEVEKNNQYLTENEAFIRAISTGEKGRSYIDNILPTARLLDALYESAAKRREVVL